MKRTLLATLSALAVSFVAFSGVAAAGDTCFICTSDSTDSCKDAKYCDPGGPDTSDNRKKCQAKGCKIGGTASCPDAANVKVCKASVFAPEADTLDVEPTLGDRISEVTYVLGALLRGECVAATFAAPSPLG